MKKKKVKNIKDDQNARSDLNIGQVGVENMTSVSWRQIWSELQCVPSSHHINKEEESEEYKGWPRCSRNNPNVGQIGIDHMASMSWRQRWCEL